MRNHGVFPNLMTGNTMKFVENVTYQNVPLMLKYLSMIVGYTFGGALFTSIQQRLDKQQQQQQAATVSSSSSSSVQKNPPSILRRVSIVASTMFIVSDLMYYMIRRQVSIIGNLPSSLDVTNLLYLPFMSVVFGMLNSATMTATNQVTNAVTGLYRLVGAGIVSANVPKATTTSSTASMSPSMSAAWSLMSYGVGIAVVSLWSSLSSLSSSTLMSKVIKSVILPPVGTTLAILYTLLFEWYTRITTNTKTTTTSPSTATSTSGSGSTATGSRASVPVEVSKVAA
jgi:uncharacterized membrane protein YoaK (UPF0700 family)